jgi:hypothetical protein
MKSRAEGTLQPVKPGKVNRRIGLFLWGLALLTILSPARLVADDSTNQFLFLTLRLKGGTATLEKAQKVSGRLKKQLDSTDAESLLINLEKSSGEESWSVTIADPSIERLEYEDPDQPGALKSKVVQLDDVEFVVRAPLIVGVRQLAVYRKEKKESPPGKSSLANESKRLLVRINLPDAVVK